MIPIRLLLLLGWTLTLWLPVDVDSQPPTGTIQGNVTFQKLPSVGPKSSVSGDYSESEGEVRLNRKERLKAAWNEVILFVSDADPDDGVFAGNAVWDSVDPKEARITQIEKKFIPSVLPVVVGTTVKFPNEDPFFHNVFSLSSISKFDLGKYSRTDPQMSYRFEKPGVAQIFCDIHRHMTAVVVVLENPYFTKPNAEGEFQIENVPEGSWNIVAWHPRLKQTSRSIELHGRQSLSISLEFQR